MDGLSSFRWAVLRVLVPGLQVGERRGPVDSLLADTVSCIDAARAAYERRGEALGAGVGSRSRSGEGRDCRRTIRPFQTTVQVTRVA